MSHSSELERHELQSRLHVLWSIVKRTEQLQTRYNAIVKKNQRRELKPARPWRPHWIAPVAIMVVIAFVPSRPVRAVVSMLYLAIPVALMCAAIVLLLRFPAARKLALLSLSLLAIWGIGIALVAFSPNSDIKLVGVIISIGSPFVAIFLGLLIHDHFIPTINARILRYNQRNRQVAINKAAEQLAPIERELSSIRDEYYAGRYHGWFPDRFFEEQSVQGIYQVVCDHRASTLQEAINVHVQDIHNQYMRNQVDRQIALAQIQIRETERARRSAALSAAMTTGMVAFQGAMTRSAIRSRF